MSLMIAPKYTRYYRFSYWHLGIHISPMSYWKQDRPVKYTFSQGLGRNYSTLYTEIYSTDIPPSVYIPLGSLYLPDSIALNERQIPTLCLKLRTPWALSSGLSVHTAPCSPFYVPSHQHSSVRVLRSVGGTMDLQTGCRQGSNSTQRRVSKNDDPKTMPQTRCPKLR